MLAYRNSPRNIVMAMSKWWQYTEIYLQKGFILSNNKLIVEYCNQAGQHCERQYILRVWAGVEEGICLNGVQLQTDKSGMCYSDKYSMSLRYMWVLYSLHLLGGIEEAKHNQAMIFTCFHWQKKNSVSGYQYIKRWLRWLNAVHPSNRLMFDKWANVPYYMFVEMTAIM